MLVEPTKEVIYGAPPVPLRRRSLRRLVTEENAAVEVIKSHLRLTRRAECGKRDVLVLLVGRPQRRPFTELAPRHQQPHPNVFENLP
jgi:hypothetical protein